MNMNLIPTTAVRPSSFGMPLGDHASVAPKAACAAVVWPLEAGRVRVSAPIAAHISVLTQGGVAFKRDDLDGTATRVGLGTLAWSPPTV